MNSATGGDIIFHFKGDSSSLENSTNKMKGMTKSILVATGVTKTLSAGFNLITSSTDDAIKRFDTLNNFPKVMSNLGIGAKEAEESIQKMSDKLQGLPTTLDAGAMAVQRFTSANGDVAKSTDMFLALNNAILAGGAGADIQASALEQLSQAYAKGKPDMMEWRTMMTAMPAQLKQVATAMGYVSTDDLGEELRKGYVSMDDFMDTVMELNTTGLDGFLNFEEQARNATGGVATGVKVMKTRVTQGVTEMIKAIDNGMKENGLGSLSEMFVNVGNKIKGVLIGLAPIITKGIEILSKIFQWVDKNRILLGAILVPIASFVLAIKTIGTTVSVVKGIMLAFHAVMAINPFVLIVAGIVALVALFVYLGTQCEWFSDFWIGIWEGIKATFSGVVEGIKYFIDSLVAKFTIFVNNLKLKINMIIGFFRNFVNEVKSVPGKILGFFTSLTGKMASVGLNVVKGIGRGITSGVSWIKNQIKSFVGNVTSFIKKIFKIGSPSKLMANQVGQWIPKGIAVGIDANTDSVFSSMEEMQNMMLDSFALSSQLVGSSALHYSPNIIVNNEINSSTDPLGQTVTKIKTFANGAKNDYNYGMGV